MLTLDHYTAIQERFESGDGFAFARFNDGEMRGVKAIGDTVARGDQYIYPGLHTALVKALQHEQKDYWKGFPCKTCYPDLRQLYHTYVSEDKPYQTYAVTLCNNGHWKKFIDQFGKLVGNRKLVWISGEDQSIHGLHSILDVNNIDLHIQLPVRNAWSVYDKITGYGSEFKSGSVVVMSCGPLATVLACELFKVRQDCVFFDAGSLFDPYTRNVWHGCHTGKLKYCPECNHV